MDVPFRRRVPSAPPLAALALLALAGCGGEARTAVVTRTETVVRTVTEPAPPTTTPTAATTGTTAPPAGGAGAPLTLRAAEQALDARGYAALTERDFRPGQTLEVLIGIRRALPRAELAFFFAGDRLIGTDTREPSGAIEVVAQSEDRVTLGYGLYRPGDALCCASGGTARVTYVWDGARLTPRQPIPTADPGASLSRR